MTAQRPTALIAEDEPLLRESLEQQLTLVWPELTVVARARNGREAMDLFDLNLPDVCFLDVHMPGVSGVEAARHIGQRAHLVFVTAYDQYAVQAFAQGALDYLVKPVDSVRLAQTAVRLQERMRTAISAVNTEVLLQQLAATLERQSAAAPLRWIRASMGQTITLIAVDDIDFLRADEKYTVVAWHEADGALREAVIRTPLKDLAAQLDPAQFAQVHRSVVVNLSSIARLVRGANETADIHLKKRAEILPVSRSYLHLFHQM
jgi:DNA-binding LytR/AlgR family response regulator